MLMNPSHYRAASRGGLLLAVTFVLAGATCTPEQRANARLACTAASILHAGVVAEQQERHVNALNGLCALIPTDAQPASTGGLAAACEASDEAVTGPQTPAQRAARAAAGCTV